MEIILAIVVVAAVIFFGALISMGNERQRRAIDNLREQIVLWAVQDLKVKRERLARDVRVDDPIGWLNKVVSRVYGHRPNLQVVEAFSEPRVLVCSTGDGMNQVLFSPISPDEIRRLLHGHRNRLSKYTDGNPLLTLPRKINAYEFNGLNSGFLFDLELPLTWKHLTNQEIDQMERVWMYIV